MTVNNELDINTLNWVKSEIDETMKQARTSLEAYVEDQSDESQILFCINYLHQVYGTLQMVELYGASLLAEELELLANAIHDNKVKNKEEAFEVLIRGSLQLPDYLEKLQAGQKDTPIVLLPLFNDMRAARSEALLSETALFNPDLDITAPVIKKKDDTVIDKHIAELAAEQRHQFHLGLLGWFKNKNVDKCLDKISDILQKLRSVAEEQNTSRMLWVADGLVDSLKNKGIEASVAVKSLVGQVDRNIKQIIDGGEVALALEPPNELLKNLLYYIAGSSAAGDKTKEIKALFKLSDVMPDTQTLEKARADLNSPNMELMDTVSRVLREDMQQVKDSLDIFMRGTDNNVDVLKPVSEKLASMADTLGMLSLGPQRKGLIEKIAVIDSLIEGSRPVNEAELMEIASTIIELEQTFDSMSETTVVATDSSIESTQELKAPRRQPKSAEERKLLEPVIAEAKVDISSVKEAVSEFSRQLNHPEVLNDVPALLDKVRGSLNILQLDRAAKLMLDCKKYIEDNLIPSKTIPELETLDYLADAISSIEYYMESLVDSWGEPTAILNVAAASIEQLEKSLDQNKPTVRDPSASQDAITVDPALLVENTDDTVINLSAPAFQEQTEEDISSDSVEQTITDLEQPYFDEPETVSDLEQPTFENDSSALDTVQNLEQPDFTQIDSQSADSLIDFGIETEEQSDSSSADSAAGAEPNADSTAETLELDLAPDLSGSNASIERLDESLGLWFMDPDSSDVSALVLEVITSLAESVASGDFSDKDKENVLRITNDMKETIQRIASSEEVFGDETEKVMLWARDALAKYFVDEDTLTEPVFDEPSDDDTDVEIVNPNSVHAVEGTSADNSFAPIEIDEEIFEIFLEEAEEEYENITKYFEEWKSNLENHEPLKEMRRSFHTLKGSGRLVGANDLGEFAWAFEGMLNRVIDNTIVATSELLELTDRGRLALPVLYDLLKSGKRPDQQIFSLMEHADSLSRGESFTPLTETISSVSIAQPDLSRLDSVAGNVEADLDDSVDKIQRPEIDSVLLEIYRKEVATHLVALREYISDWHSKDIHDVTEPLFRALHTLTGSARTTGVQVVSNLCLQLESYIKLLQTEDLLVSSDGIKLFEDSANRIEIICAQLGEQQSELYSTDDLVSRTDALMQSLQEMLATRSVDSLEVAGELDVNNSSAELQVEEDDYDEELLEIFIEEGTEILEESEHTLHAWKDEPDNAEHIEALQRQLHTLKGGARMSGVTAIGDISHRLESLITNIVDGSFTANDSVFNVLQMSHDSLLDMLEQLRAHKPLSSGQDIIDQIDAVLAKNDLAVIDEDAEPEDRSENAGEQAVSREAVEEEIREEDSVSEEENDEQSDGLTLEDISVDTETDLSVSNDLSIEIEPNDSDNTEIETVNDLSLDITGELTTLAAELDNASVDDTVVIEMPEEDSEQDEVADSSAEIPQPSVVDETRSASDELTSVQDDSDEDVLSVLEAQQPAPQKTAPAEQVRVRADVLDNLVNFAGEVSIYRSRLEQQVNTFRFNLQELDETVERFRGQLRTFEIETEAQIQTRKEEAFSSQHEHFDPLEFDRFTQMQQISRSMLESMNDIDSLRSILSSLNRESETLLVQQSRVNTELQEGLMSTRLVPFEKQVNRLKRIVRQTSSELGKQISIEFNGTDMELDRSIVERMMPPIEHMLRNAIAHGIEMPEDRKASGKQEEGRLIFTMSREGSDVVIQVEDDGAGIDFDAIKSKAVEKGIIKEGAEVSDKFLLDQILESGFSTADEVTQIAGRGVGMDVVNNEIKQLGGVLNIDTAKGKGTTFTVSMPLSLAVSRALMINVGDSMYAVPLLSVEGVERVSHETLVELQSSEEPVYSWIDEDFHYIHLGQLMDGATPSLPGEGNKSALLMVRSGNFRAALHIDGLVGSREIVIKPVGPQLSSLRGISGATIMGDGRVVLILDLGVLIRLALTESESRYLEAKPAVEDVEPEVVENKVPVVMVVDDSITVRKVTSRFLERNELDVIQAKDGVDALTQLLDVIPDVMLLDVEMPRMDGFELAINMRNDERLKDIPIIMITSRTGQKHRDRAMNIGVNTYMGKPYNENELLENIHSLLKADN